MPEEDQPTDLEPQDDAPPADDEEEQAWGRLSDRMRSLLREELEEHSKRQTPASTAPAAPEPEKPKPEEEPVVPSPAPRPRRTAVDVWFGRRS